MALGPAVGAPVVRSWIIFALKKDARQKKPTKLSQIINLKNNREHGLLLDIVYCIKIFIDDQWDKIVRI